MPLINTDSQIERNACWCFVNKVLTADVPFYRWVVDCWTCKTAVTSVKQSRIVVIFRPFLAKPKVHRLISSKLTLNISKIMLKYISVFAVTHPVTKGETFTLTPVIKWVLKKCRTLLNNLILQRFCYEKMQMTRRKCQSKICYQEMELYCLSLKSFSNRRIRQERAN